MTLNEATKRNYDATVMRGQITKETCVYDFITKTREELSELIESWDATYDTFDPMECVDIILVQTAMLYHHAIDVEAMIEKKVLFNEKRK